MLLRLKLSKQRFLTISTSLNILNVVCYNYIEANHSSTHTWITGMRVPIFLTVLSNCTIQDTPPVSNIPLTAHYLTLPITNAGHQNYCRLFFSGTVSFRQMYQETCCKCFIKLLKPPPAFTVFLMKWGLAYLTSQTAITYQRKSSTYLRKAYFVFSKDVNILKRSGGKNSHKIYKPLEKPYTISRSTLGTIR